MASNIPLAPSHNPNPNPSITVKIHRFLHGGKVLSSVNSLQYGLLSVAFKDGLNVENVGNHID